MEGCKVYECKISMSWMTAVAMREKVAHIYPCSEQIFFVFCAIGGRDMCLSCGLERRCLGVFICIIWEVNWLNQNLVVD